MKNVSAFIGKDFNITCHVFGIPTVYVSWLIEPRPEPAFVTGILLLNQNRTLYISNVTKHHKGQYTCTAQNKYGVDSSSAWLQPLGEFHLIIFVIALFLLNEKNLLKNLNLLTFLTNKESAAYIFLFKTVTSSTNSLFFWYNENTENVNFTNLAITKPFNISIIFNIEMSSIWRYN